MIHVVANASYQVPKKLFVSELLADLRDQFGWDNKSEVENRKAMFEVVERIVSIAELDLISELPGSLWVGFLHSLDLSSDHKDLYRRVNHLFNAHF